MVHFTAITLNSPFLCILKSLNPFTKRTYCTQKKFLKKLTAVAATQQLYLSEGKVHPHSGGGLHPSVTAEKQSPKVIRAFGPILLLLTHTLSIVVRPYVYNSKLSNILHHEHHLPWLGVCTCLLRWCSAAPPFGQESSTPRLTGPLALQGILLFLNHNQSRIARSFADNSE